MTVRTLAQPYPEFTHEVRDVARRWRRKDHVALGVGNGVRSFAVLAWCKHRVDVIEHELVDVAKQRLVCLDALIVCNLINERQRLGRAKDLKCLLPREARLSPGHQVLDFERVQAVSFDPRCPMDRPNPCALAEPLRVLWIERQVVENLTSLLKACERAPQLRRL